MKILFDKGELKHIKDKSYYDNNYYKILNCGDSLTNFESLVLYQHYDEMFNIMEYELGVFENNKFNVYISWCENYECDDLKYILEKVDKGEQYELF